ncbi:ABC transporter substrate-binding protein [Gordonia oryzae]|nr:ABC transporter substrate-binding protein [Gordonia oryzae]
MRDLRSFGSLRRLPGIFMVLVGVIALVVAGCSNDDSSTGAGGNSAIQPTTVDVAKQSDIAALLPAGIRESGQLIVGVNVPYAPNEFKDSSGQIIGFDVDLMNAIGKALGLTPVYKEADFDKIIPSIQAGTFNIGMSSFTDNKEREAQVDFVNYFSAGIQWAQQAGGNIDPNNACGKKVAVQSTTVEDTDEVPAKSKACTDAGKPAIQIQKYTDQSEATNALVLGRVDAMSADSPVTAYAIKQAGGKIVAAGPVFDSAPYGYPIAKGSSLVQAVQKAVQYLIDNGQYKAIAEHWGVEAGVIPTATVNGATS